MERNKKVSVILGRKRYWLSFSDVVAIIGMVSTRPRIANKIETMPLENIRMLLRHPKAEAATTDYLCKNGRL